MSRNPFIKPAQKPKRPYFASGPCAKFPGWSLDLLKDAYISRSHRSKEVVEELHDIVTLLRTVHQIPSDYHIAIVPGSATGAMEMALWNLLGPEHIVIMSQDVFSHRWEYDVTKSLKLTNVDIRNVRHGLLPPTNRISESSDILMNWNGSTSGVQFPDAQFISDKHKGIVICDITSAAFTTTIDWKLFDAVVFSWQKGLGSEAAHGVLVLSPKAVQRINTYKPKWPIPYIFKLRKHEDFYEPLFQEKTLNTPSMMCIRDFKCALEWAQSLESRHKKSLEVLVDRSRRNFNAISSFIDKTHGFEFLCEDPRCYSTSSIVIKVVDERVTSLEKTEQRSVLKGMVGLLAQERVGFELLNHPSAPPSLRIWGGPTVETEDIEALLPWLPWALEEQFL